MNREHIEAFKTWLSTHPTPATGKPLNRVSIKNALINLHCFLTRITEWGYPNAPVRPLMFPGDLPIVDKPLPRFLDDAAAAKLLRAAHADPDPLSRLIVELLARTGIRRGELLALTADAVVQIGSAYWLRIPIGKLHNDRYIPLHPQLKELLDDWITHHRPSGLRTNRLLLEHNRPISGHRITKALRHLADTAGIGAVTAHQLRHTLATQAINRGMSLDAIAALLGHKTLAMTMIYARIADRTVADEYFAVTEKVEALYDQPRRLASDDEGAEMPATSSRFICGSKTGSTARSTTATNYSGPPAKSMVSTCRGICIRTSHTGHRARCTPNCRSLDSCRAYGFRGCMCTPTGSWAGAVCGRAVTVCHSGRVTNSRMGSPRHTTTPSRHRPSTPRAS